MLQSVLLTLHVLVAVGLIAMVMIQHGRGADAGAAFGSGSSGTVFGARGASGFLTKATALLGALFFGISLSLAYLTTQNIERASVVDRVESAIPSENSSDVPVAPDALSTGSDMPVAPKSE